MKVRGGRDVPADASNAENTAPRARWVLARRGLATTAATVLIAGMLPFGAAQAADGGNNGSAPKVDGKSSETAAASCWEIKQLDPSSKSGSYWLYTPQMEAPAQFWCDQDTDGGGWVMVGRGRQGWKETYAGYGNPDDIAKTPSGSGAFKPVELPSKTVDALLNGQKPQDLPDGVRLSRAMDAGGTKMQDVRFNRQYSSRWSWTFRSQTPVKNISFKNPAGSGQPDYAFSGTGKNSNNFGSSGYNVVNVDTNANKGWNMGFGYAQGIGGGSTDANNNLWSQTPGFTLPFTQMYLRPKTRQADLAKLQTNAQGVYAGSTRRGLPNSFAERTSWGVDGNENGRVSEMNTLVQGIAQVGNTVFVGGNFSRLQQDKNGTGAINQPYVAGLDVNTLQPVRSFIPKLNGQVKTLHEVDGKLAIGGEFTTVNGKPHPGFVVVDPNTGQIDPAWENTTIKTLSATGTTAVRDMDVYGGYLYLGGQFTHGDGPSAKNVWSSNAMRIKISDKNPDRTWNPNLNGTVLAISASKDGVFTAGYFSKAGTSDAFRLASLNPTNGTLARPWNWQPSYVPADKVTNYNWGFQMSIQATGDGNVWAGGSEHMIHGYDAATLTRQHISITRDGGDFQTLSQSGDTVFGGCHCGDWNYQDAQYHDQNKSPWTVADQISLIGAYDRATGDYLPEFNPQLKGPGGWGVWESFTDSRGVLWAGGSLDTSAYATDRNQWSGGFARFAPRDTVAPGTPGNLKVSSKDGKDQLSWDRSAEAGVTYQIIRDGRVIGSTQDPKAEFQHVDGARYAVRAMDSNKNYSASTALVTAQKTDPTPTPTPTTPKPTTPAPTPTLAALTQTGDTWEYKQGVKAPAADWNAQGSKDVQGWSRGASPLGWGDKGLGTAITRDPSNPLTTYYRKTVKLPANHGDLKLSTYADDGLILYVNGKEVQRTNMPDGAVTENTHSTKAPRTAAAKGQPVEVTVPAADLPASGDVVLAAEVHANWRTSTDSTFDLKAVPQGGAQNAAPQGKKN